MRLLKQAAIFAALMFVAVPAFSPAAAFAQVVATDAVVVTHPTFLSELIVALVPIFGLVITTLIGIGLAFLKQKTGIDVEAQHRIALQSALMNGMLFAIQRMGWVPGQPTDRLLAAARSYVEQSVPDALAKFGIDAATDVGRATLDRLLTPKLPVPPGTVMPNGDVLIGRAP
ncbi:hypothetical protein [Devosia aurantiaca]|uniref:Uncharacterized protein n=1 Tax=Devosia aurantiaca TaxID=2714858 RepID=A0A6M1SRL2_9HYPH|nr:hypothetical protein [Devosia aurantiaca]NGP19284.1 hypothetical protein [Devosia aurantiaca]